MDEYVAADAISTRARSSSLCGRFTSVVDDKSVEGAVADLFAKNATPKKKRPNDANALLHELEEYQQTLTPEKQQVVREAINQCAVAAKISHHRLKKVCPTISSKYLRKRLRTKTCNCCTVFALPACFSRWWQVFFVFSRAGGKFDLLVY